MNWSGVFFVVDFYLFVFLFYIVYLFYIVIFVDFDLLMILYNFKQKSNMFIKQSQTEIWDQIRKILDHAPCPEKFLSDHCSMYTSLTLKNGSWSETLLSYYY